MITKMGKKKEGACLTSFFFWVCYHMCYYCSTCLHVCMYCTIQYDTNTVRASTGRFRLPEREKGKIKKK